MFNATGNDYRQAYKTGYPVCGEQKMGFVIVRTIDGEDESGAKRFYGIRYLTVKFPAVKL